MNGFIKFFGMISKDVPKSLLKRYKKAHYMTYQNINVPLIMLAGVLSTACPSYDPPSLDDTQASCSFDENPFKSSDYHLLGLSITDLERSGSTTDYLSTLIRGVDLPYVNDDVTVETSPYHDVKLQISLQKEPCFENPCFTIRTDLFGYGSESDGFSQVTVSSFSREDISRRDLGCDIRGHLNTLRSYVGSSKFRKDLQQKLDE